MPIDRPSQLGLSAAMRARDASRPRPEHLPAPSEAELAEKPKEVEPQADADS
ncbi:hypothetical protein [Tenggerimyces flavus]|uniref:Uncharacterized protein n=1 Tax=Tenggerimyces flavus TaxID=1708749 RepID=A0ABV7YMB9_9ACTN|nr:hypothetical protein [Tenggerimyces flavus]MBM7789481.1 hypothetical protein [Tenggerimyces flavus]